MPQAPTTFREDRRAGEAIEQAVGRWAISRGWTALRTCGCVAGYDLLLQCTVEVKFDRMAVSTGNVAVEVEFRGKPSGIETTTAPWWCLVVGDVGYIVRTSKLRALAYTCEERPGGDGKQAVLRLVPLEKLAAIAHQVHLPGISPAEQPEPENNGRSTPLRQQPLFLKEPEYAYPD